MSTSQEKPTFDPARRRLCPDGTCIGLLDDSGRCKECGQVAGARATEAAPTAPTAPPDDVDPDMDIGTDDDDDAAGQSSADEPMDAGAPEGARFDPARRLCPDGSCLGVLGSDGRCSVCGRTAEG
jgi:hypothetical protein